MNRPVLHVLLNGESGTGKDTFAETWPKPMIVWHLDGHGQDMPYINSQHDGKAQQVSEMLNYKLGELEIPYRDIVTAKGEFIRIEYFSSSNPLFPNAAAMLEARMSYFGSEQDQWATLVCGSLSSAALESRLYDQYVLNPSYKDNRKHFGAATDFVERLIVSQKALPCNVVFICHISRDKDEMNGEMVYGPDLPGRLSTSAGRYFGEIYRLWIGKDDKGDYFRALQTMHDGRYQAKTHVAAPDGCYPHYESLWVNWDK
jgi:hypothetical protein